MEQFTNDVTFIFKKNINTIEELDDYQSSIEIQKIELVKERRNLYSKIKRCRKPEYRKLFEQDKQTLSEQISVLNREIKNCNSIRERVKTMENKLVIANHIEKENTQEKRKETKTKC